MIERQRNWAGNLEYQATNWQAPTSVEDIQAMIRDSQRIKSLGSRHSFSTIGDSEDTILSLQHLNNIIELDKENRMVTIEGGMTYGQLCQQLHEQGFALPNLASLPHITVVGACMTGTHGSGEANGGLATAVSAIEFVSGSGEVVRRSSAEHGDEFAGMVVSLGALGIVTSVTLDIVPTYDVRQDVYLNVPFNEVYDNFDAIQASAYSISLFTHWDNDECNQVWVKSLVDDDHPFTLGDTFFGGQRATVQCSPVGDDQNKRCTEQGGVPGPWYARLPHFRMEYTPSHGDEIQSEFFVPRDRAVDGIQALNELHEQISPVLRITEVRTIAGDDLWLSPMYQRDTVAFHFTWKPMWEAVRPVVKNIESALLPFDARPHWGKVFTMSKETIEKQYNRLDDFRALMRRYDPEGKFHNPFLEQYIL